MNGRGEQLRDFRMKVGLNQTVVANVFGISQTFLSKIEHGKKNCPDDLYKELMEYYDTMNQTEGLEAIFDYVRIRIPSHNVKLVIEDILLMDFESFYRIFERENPLFQ